MGAADQNNQASEPLVPLSIGRTAADQVLLTPDPQPQL